MSNKTHCVTFKHGGKICWAINTDVPTGLFEPEPRCAMSYQKAHELAKFLRTESTFPEITVRALKLKGN